MATTTSTGWRSWSASRSRARMLEITPDLLLQAYRIGVFPMGESRDDPKLYWLDPRMRAVLPLDAFHLSHRLARTVRSGHFEVSADTAFAETVRACAEPRPGHPESWINEPIVALYTERCWARRSTARQPFSADWAATIPAPSCRRAPADRRRRGPVRTKTASRRTSSRRTASLPPAPACGR